MYVYIWLCVHILMTTIFWRPPACIKFVCQEAWETARGSNNRISRQQAADRREGVRERGGRGKKWGTVEEPHTNWLRTAAASVALAHFRCLSVNRTQMKFIDRNRNRSCNNNNNNGGRLAKSKGKAAATTRRRRQGSTLSALLLLLLSLWQPCDGVHMLPCTSRRRHDNNNMTMGRPMAAANAVADLLPPHSPLPATASYSSWLKITTNATLRGTAHHPVVHVKPTTYQHCALTSFSVSAYPLLLPSPLPYSARSWAAGGHNGRQQ